MRHKIVPPPESFTTSLPDVSSRLVFNRPCLNVNCTYLSQTHTFFFKPPFVRGFLSEKYVTNGLWINKEPNWIRLSCKVIVKSLKAPQHFIQISEFSGRAGPPPRPTHTLFSFFCPPHPVAYNAPFVILSQQWFGLRDVLGVIYLPKQSH